MRPGNFPVVILGNANVGVLQVSSLIIQKVLNENKLYYNVFESY